MKTVAYELLRNVMISVHGRDPVSAKEFPEVLASFRRLDFENVKMLVVTEGGGPTPQQRKEMVNAMGGREMLTAVVSDEVMIRGVVTALSWFNSKIKSFRSADLDGAMRYLGVSPARFDELRAEVAALQASLRAPVGA
jgi:hypothetical protein